MLRESVNENGVAVPEAGDRDTRGEVEVALVLLCIEFAAVAAGKL